MDFQAMQYVLNVSGYNFVRPQQSRVVARLLLGEGLLFYEGIIIRQTFVYIFAK
jgi:hypothetical protein